MKTFLIVLAVWSTYFFFACNKEPQGYGQDEGCNCGIICEDGIDTPTQCHWLLVENDCSGNTKRFCVDPLVWSAYPVGDRICINNQSAW